MDDAAAANILRNNDTVSSSGSKRSFTLSGSGSKMSFLSLSMARSNGPNEGFALRIRRFLLGTDGVDASKEDSFEEPGFMRLFEQGETNLNVLFVDNIPYGRPIADYLMENLGVSLLKLTAMLLYFFASVVLLTTMEDWSYVDAIYFITVTLTTVGYGTLVPETAAGKIFIMAWAPLGFVVVISVLSDTVKFIVRNGQANVSYARRQYMKRIAESQRGKPLSYKEEGDVAPHGLRILLGAFTFGVLVVIGAVFAALHERHSLLDAIFWAFQTSTTIGYGNLPLERQSSRAFTTVYIMFVVVIGTVCVGEIRSAHVAMLEEDRRDRLLRRQLQRREVFKLTGGESGINKLQYVTGMLIVLGKITSDDVTAFEQRFDELDTNHNGYINADDLEKDAMDVEHEAEKILGNVNDNLNARATLLRFVGDSAMGSVRSLFADEDEGPGERIRSRTASRRRFTISGVVQNGRHPSSEEKQPVGLPMDEDLSKAEEGEGEAEDGVGSWPGGHRATNSGLFLAEEEKKNAFFPSEHDSML